MDHTAKEQPDCTERFLEVDRPGARPPHRVAQRTNEIGIRMALGATRGAMSRMVLADALQMSCWGLMIGLPTAYWGRRFAASLIQDLPLDSAFPIVFGALTMIAIALIAAYVPARRAARVDPMEALRCE